MDLNWTIVARAHVPRQVVLESTAAKRKLKLRVADAGEETAGRTVVSDYVSEGH